MPRGNRGVKSHHWDVDEDEHLTQLVKTHGAQNWPFIASHMPTREAKQCRERWLYHLSPDIKKGKLTDEEWTLVVKLQSQLGNRWSAIASRIPGRSPNQIKNHWHSYNRRQANRRKRTGSKPAHVSSAPASTSASPAMTPVMAPQPPTYDPALFTHAMHTHASMPAFSPSGLNIVVPPTPLMNLPTHVTGGKRPRPFESGYNLRAKRRKTPENSSVEEESEELVVPATPTTLLNTAGLEMLVQAMYDVEKPEVFAEFDRS